MIKELTNRSEFINWRSGNFQTEEDEEKNR